MRSALAGWMRTFPKQLADDHRRPPEQVQVPDTWNVGDSCMMAFGKKNYQIDIIGKNHDDYADGFR